MNPKSSISKIELFGILWCLCMGVVAVRFGGPDRPAEGRVFMVLQTADANGVPWPCQFDLVGDLNGDCRVDFKDVALLADNWLIDCNLALGDRRCHRKEYK